MIKILIIGFILFSGCSFKNPIEWKHSIKNNSLEDEEECRKVVCMEYKIARIKRNEVINGVRVSSTSLDPLKSRDIKKCMKTKGWVIKDLDYTHDNVYFCN